MRTVLVRIVIVAAGVLALPVTAALLDGWDDSGSFLLTVAVVVALAAGALVGAAGLDPVLRVRDRMVAGILWAFLGVVLAIGSYALVLGSMGS